MRTLPGRRTAVAPVAALVALLVGVLVVTAGCGRGGDGAAADRSPSPADDAVTVAILTGTAAGGEVDPTPVPLDTPFAAAAFAAQFDSGDFARRVELQVAHADVADGRTLVGAVVAIGCQVPDDVEAVGRPGELRIMPVMPAKPSPKECFAPMTSVGLMDVPDALLEPAE